MSCYPKRTGHELPNKEKVFARIGLNHQTSHAVIIKHSGELDVEIAGVQQPNLKRATASTEEVSVLLQKVHLLKACEGTECGGRSTDCKGSTTAAALRCKPCKLALKVIKQRRRKQHKLKRKMVQKRKETFKLKRSTSNRKRKVQLMFLTKSQILTPPFHAIGSLSSTTLPTTTPPQNPSVKQLRNEVERMQKKCASMKKEKISNKIKDLPIEQQKVVMTILDSSKRKGPTGRRYEVEWVYLCILMRIKSPALYNHLRLGSILPLPSHSTLERYMRKLHPIYGYQETLFQVLADKVADLPEAQRHGAILVDEMKLAPGVTFHKNTLETMGFVDLGKHTPDSLENEMGDHALVVMFQPFQGDFTQTLGCFLTKGNVKAPLQARLLLEGITLAENAGLFVDAVVWDGASWNRQTWDHFGVGEKSSSCAHPDGSERRLWFFSDWNHLLKCMRNALCPQEKGSTKANSEEASKKTSGDSSSTTSTKSKPNPDDKTLVTPDGLVKRRHWTALLNEEGKRRQSASTLLVCPKLTREHIYPTGFERMNVRMAYQFFSNSTAAGMEWYRTSHVGDLQDSEPTEAFVRKINKLADAMNSSTAKGALWEGSEEEKVIDEFELYHLQCMKLARENGRDAFFSRQTDLGLRVTLRSTLELSKFLRDEIGYQFVMTARFNQDALEQFFGSIRRAAGPNNHPDPKLFSQLYRLLSLYSLVKPPKGSNITGVGNLKTLLSAVDPVGEAISDRRQQFDALMDEILTYGEALDSMPLSCDVDHSYDTNNVKVEEPITRFLAGFTAFRKKALVKDCEACFGSLEKPRSDAISGDRLIQMKEMYHLTYPSDELAKFVREMELAVWKCVAFHGVHKDMALTALSYMRIDASLQVGCLDHSPEIKKKLMKYYLTMRMYFAAERRNEAFEQAKQRKKSLSKQSRLQ